MSMDLGSRFLRWDVDNGVATLTLDRPDSRNAMTASMYVGVRRAVMALNQSPKLHALVITGSGETFCAGGDMAGGHDTDDPRGMEMAGVFGTEVLPCEAIRNSRKPVIAMVNGLCQGGGLLMTLVSDVAVVSETARFRAPEVFRGVADTNYAAYLPAHIGLARARDLLLTGRWFSAAEALDMGVIARVVDPGELRSVTDEVVRDMVRAAPEARWQLKRIMNARYGAIDWMTLDASVFGPEMAEGFGAFAEKRSPNWIPEGFEADDRL